MTYFWPESGNCIIFDETNAVLDEIYTFIEEALEVPAHALAPRGWCNACNRRHGGVRRARRNRLETVC